MDLRGVSADAHTYRATATNDAGNTSGRWEAVVVTIEMPVERTVDTVITGGPSGTIDTDKVRFEFESNEEGATFECSLDDGPFEPCVLTTVFSVSKGSHVFQVGAVKVGNNVDQTPASWAFTVALRDWTTPP